MKHSVRQFCIFFAFCGFLVLAFFSCSKNKALKNEETTSTRNISSLQKETEPYKKEEVLVQKSALEDLPAEQTVEQKNPSVKDIDLASYAINPSEFLRSQVDFSANLIYDFTDLYVLGFSKDGKLACLENQTHEGRGGSSVQFFIQDLVSDECAFSYPQKDEECFYDDGENGIALFVAQYFSVIDDALSAQNIQLKSAKFEPFPYTDASRRIDVSVQTLDTGERLYDFLKIIDYACIAQNQDGKTKTVLSKKAATVDEVFPCGYIKSPYENRLALLFAEKRYGFEGYDLWYTFTGCHITVGF